MIDRGHWVLPDQLFLRHFRAEIARARAQVAVGQLEPCTGERLGEGLGFSRKRREIFSYTGSTRNDISVVSMVGLRFFDGSWGSGMIASASLASHWCAGRALGLPHSYSNRFSKKWLLHCAGVCVQMTSRPLLTGHWRLPVP